MHRRTAHGQARAFSLLEVMVAVSLLAGVLFTLGVLIPRGVMHLHNKGFEAVASQMAEQILDETRGLDQADVPSGTWDGRALPGVPLGKPARRGGSPRQFPPAPYPSRDVDFRFNGVDTKSHYEFQVQVLEPIPPVVGRVIQITVYWTEPGNNGGDPVPRTWTVASQLGP